MNDTGSVRNINIQDILVSTVNKSKWTLILSIVYIGSSKELHRVELFACETDNIIVIEGKLFTDFEQLSVHCYNSSGHDVHYFSLSRQ